MNQKHISKSIYTENYLIDDNTFLTIDSGAVVRIKTLVCRKDVMVHIDGGSLIVDSGSADANFTLSGRGTLKIISDFATNGHSSIHAENISIDLTDATLNMASGELYLDNYPIIGGEIISERGKIIASKKYIFNGTTLSGKFVSDVAYPEWFVDGDTDNWAPAINRAFETAGEVHLDNRVYRLKETIWIPPVGRLIGTSGGENGENGYGTVLLTNSTSSTGFNYSENYIIKINLQKNSNTPTLNFPKVGAKVSDLRIDNHYIGGGNNTGSKPLYGIFAAFNAEIDNVTFDFLAVAIKWTSDYTDLKKITRCSFNEMLVSEKADDYIVDFGYLGDALIFEGNAIHGGGSRKGILIETCNSGILTSNIINADVVIKTSKGITFSNNHMERGVQIIIDQSDVTISNNFIMKGQYPSVVIKSNRWGNSAVVTLNNNQYIYNVETDDYQSPKGMSDYDIAVAGEKYIETNNGVSITKYSHPQCIINISNELRYRVTFNEIGRNMMSGISMGVSEDGGENFHAAHVFNNRSQIYSRMSIATVYDGQIKISYPSVTIMGWNSINVNFNAMGEADFGLLPGKYYYYSQIILDYDRKWAMPLQSITNLELNDGKHFMLFLLFGAAKLGNSVMVRMIRTSGTEYANPVYADIPLVNAFSFYDDGRAVGGYKWNKANNFENAVFSGTSPTFNSFTLIGDSVITED